MSDENGRDGHESTVTASDNDWDEIKDPQRTKDLLRKLREENRRSIRASKESAEEPRILREEKAEREAEAERQRETKLREQQKNEELVKDRDVKLSKKEERIKSLESELESFKVTTWFGRHVGDVATKAGISATLARAILRDAGGGDIKQFAPEESTPEIVEAHVALLRERHPELFEKQGNSGGSPLTPMLNTQTKPPGEVARSTASMTKEQRAAHYRERGRLASGGKPRS